MLIEGVKMQCSGKTMECSSSFVVRSSTENRTPPEHHHDILREFHLANSNHGQSPLHSYVFWQNPSSLWCHQNSGLPANSPLELHWNVTERLPWCWSWDGQSVIRKVVSTLKFLPWASLDYLTPGFNRALTQDSCSVATLLRKCPIMHGWFHFILNTRIGLGISIFLN